MTPQEHRLINQAKLEALEQASIERKIQELQHLYFKHGERKLLFQNMAETLIRKRFLAKPSICSDHEHIKAFKEKRSHRNNNRLSAKMASDLLKAIERLKK